MKPIRWEAYQKNFTERYNELVSDLMEPGATEYNGGPRIHCTASGPRYASQAPFKSDWGICFSDGRYFRVKECFNRMGYPHTGMGIREHFSFHYGLAAANLASDGFPIINRPETPVADLRIDVDVNLDPHIHHMSADHLPQSRVQGFIIKDAEMFQFIEAVKNHRQTRTPLVDLLKITLI